MPGIKSLGDLLSKSFTGNSEYSTTYSRTLLDEVSSNFPSLREINFNSKGLTNDQIKCLCEALIRNRIVVKLDLSNNKITDAGAGYLGYMLKFNTSLREICLDRNEIGPKGTAAIASALATNKTLECLSIQGNQIGVEGAGALAASLCNNHTVTLLCIDQNNIPKHHSIHGVICKMLRSNGQYPENRSLVLGVGEELNSLISNMPSDVAEDLVLQAEKALRTAMDCRRRGDIVGAAEAEGIFIRICTKGNAPQDPPEENTTADCVHDDPPTVDNEFESEIGNTPTMALYSRKQSEPDRLDELNDELKLLTFNGNDQEEEMLNTSFEQLADSIDNKEGSLYADAIVNMPEQFLDKAKMDELVGDAFEVEGLEEGVNDVSDEWIGDVHATK